MPAWQQASLTPPGEAIRTGTVEVLLDVVVRDRRGKPVKNVKANEIEIFEDGVRQEIKSFSQATGTRSRKQTSDAKATPGQPATAAMPLRAVNLLCIVLHNLDPVSRTRAARALDVLVKEEFPQGLYAGIFTLDDHLAPIAPFTNNRAEVAKAIQDAYSGKSVDFDKASEAILTASPNRMVVTALVDMAGRSASVTARVSGGEVSRAAVTSADVSTGSGANALRGDRARERVDFANISGMRAMDQVQTMLSRFATLPGRKSVLLVSTGLLTTGDPDAYDAVTRFANQNNITIYSLDPTELNETSDSQAANIALSQVAATSRTQTQVDQPGQIGGAAAARNRSRQGDSLEVAVRSSDPLAALRALAEGTGGFLVANTSEYQKPFDKILDDIDAHYQVSYRPTQTVMDGRLREIKVNVTRKDTLVESRTGYFALPQSDREPGLEPYEVIGLAALGGQPQPATFDFSTGVYSFGKDPKERNVAVAFEVPGASLGTTVDETNATARVHTSLVALLKNSHGDVIDRYSQDSPLDLPAASVPLLKKSNVSHAHTFNVAPGRYTAEAAMLDRQTGNVSTKSIEFDVPAPVAGLSVSPLILVQRVEPASGGDAVADPLVYQGQRVIPMVSPQLGPDMKPHVYFVVYPDASRQTRPTIKVEFLVQGKLLASQTSELPAPDASGSIPMLISAAIRPGFCELRITAIQGDATATGSVRYLGPAAQ